MGRRICETDATTSIEPPRKRTRTVSENCELNSSVIIDQPLPPGEILTDVTQKQWRIGKPIGCGSFGEIYLASDDVTNETTAQNSRYVIKIEPHSNGPLFVEIHCLIRTARHSKIKKWQNEKKLNLLGMPHYIANGSHLLDDTRYRFLVLPRYECDVEKIFRSSSSHTMQLRNVLVLGAQIIDILEYLHSQGYAHSDIKSSNLMVGFDGSHFTSQNCNQIKQTSSTATKRIDKKITPKIKYASYYYDEDFVLHNYLSSNSNTDYETDDDSNDVVEKSRNTKLINLSKDTKPKKSPSVNFKGMRMRGLFNLRKLKSDVNYEDLNSSICSYDSYQDLLESNNAKNKVHFTQPYEQLQENNCLDNGDDNEINHFEEAVCSQSSGQVYLLDFGLASKFVDSDGTHKEFEMDQRKAHDGTLEFSSRDSHIGAHSRRSDLENLGYNILDWLTGSLPWKTPEMLQDPTLVHALKKSCMEDITQLMEACFKSQNYPKCIEKYFHYLTKLEFHEKPDYQYCKNLFINEFRDKGFGTAEDMILNFKSNENVPRRKINYSKKINKNPSPDFLKRNGIVKIFGRENLHGHSWENDIRINLIRESLSNDGIRKPCISRNFFISDADLIAKLRQTLLLAHDTPSKKFSPKNLRSTKHIVKVKKSPRNNKNNIGKFGNFLGSNKQFTWAEILAGNPESIIRKIEKGKNNQCTIEKNQHSKNPRSRKVSVASDTNINNVEVNASPILLKRDYLSSLNPTYAMKEVVENYKRKALGKSFPKIDESENISNEHGYTPAMVRIMKIIEKRQKENVLIEKESKKTKTAIEKNKQCPKKKSRQSIAKRPSQNSNNDQPDMKKIQYKKGSKSKQTNKITIDENEVQNVLNVSVRKLRCRSITSVIDNLPSKTKTNKKKLDNDTVSKAKIVPTISALRKNSTGKLKKVQESQKQVPIKRIIATRSRGPVK